MRKRKRPLILGVSDVGALLEITNGRANIRDVILKFRLIARILSDEEEKLSSNEFILSIKTVKGSAEEDEHEEI